MPVEEGSEGSFELVPAGDEDEVSLLTESSKSLPGGATDPDASGLSGASSPLPAGPYAELFQCPVCGQAPTNGWCPQCHLTKGIGMPPGGLPPEELQASPGAQGDPMEEDFVLARPEPPGPSDGWSGWTGKMPKEIFSCGECRCTNPHHCVCGYADALWAAGSMPACWVGTHPPAAPLAMKA